MKTSAFFSISGWRKPKSDHEEDSPSDSGILDRRESKSETGFHRSAGLKGKMSFKTASQATLTFLSARKRIEGGLKNLGKKMSKHDVFKGMLKLINPLHVLVSREDHNRKLWQQMICCFSCTLLPNMIYIFMLMC